MTHFVYTVKWHIGNVFNKLPRQNAPTDRVPTSVILQGIEWAFRKVYSTKIPGMVHQGLLAPQSLIVPCMNALYLLYNSVAKQCLKIRRVSVYRFVYDTWENRLTVRKNRPHYDTGMAQSAVFLSLKQHFNTTYFHN